MDLGGCSSALFQIALALFSPNSPGLRAKANAFPARRSSGLMKYFLRSATSAGAIKSGGTTRRGAKMVVVDGTGSDHPDIEPYIDWNVKESQKVRQPSSTRLQDQSRNTSSGE